MLLETGMVKERTSLFSRNFTRLVNYLAQRSIISRALLTVALMYLWLCCLNFVLGAKECESLKDYIGHFFGIPSCYGWLYFLQEAGDIVPLNYPVLTTIWVVLLITIFTYWCKKSDRIFLFLFS